MKRSYHTIDKQGKANEKKLAEFLCKGGQLLLPMVDLIEQCQMACDELIDVAGRAAIQAVLGLSAQSHRTRLALLRAHKISGPDHSDQKFPPDDR